MKIKRDAFLYLAPHLPVDKFAQCGTCSLFSPEERRCAILGDRDVSATMSCGLYLHGTPHRQVIRRVVTPAEAGLVDREVRCENCASSDGSGGCNLFKKLNAALPDLFDLDEKIEAEACCNAQTPAEGRADVRLDAAVRIVNRLTSRRDGGNYPVRLELELTNWESLPQLVEFLKYVRASAGGGHSFQIGADLDADGPGRKEFGKEMVGATVFIDGDGNDHIGRMWLNGEEIK